MRNSKLFILILILANLLLYGCGASSPEQDRFYVKYDVLLEKLSALEDEGQDITTYSSKLEQIQQLADRGDLQEAERIIDGLLGAIEDENLDTNPTSPGGTTTKKSITKSSVETQFTELEQAVDNRKQQGVDVSSLAPILDFVRELIDEGKLQSASQVLVTTAKYVESSEFKPAEIVEPQSIEITIDADATKKTLNHLQGFTVGNFEETDENIKRLSQLKPKFWRMDTPHHSQKYGGKFTAVFSEVYFNEKGEGANPTKKFDDWNNAVTSTLQIVDDNNIRVDYYDTWNEPEPTEWPNVWLDFFEVYKRAHQTLKEQKPSAELIAPSTASFHSFPWEDFFEYVDDNRLTIDGVSWHEFGIPEDIPGNVNTVRTLLKNHPRLGTPEIHVNEYSSAREFLIPGWRVGWLYYLHEADVDVANMACWLRESDSYGGEGACDTSLNGLLTEDNALPTQLYWVHKYYADMDGSTLLASKSSHKRAVALASKQGDEILILVGKYSCGKQNKWCEYSEKFENDQQHDPVPLILTVENIPNSRTLTAQKIPYNGKPQALVDPVSVDLDISISGGTGTINIDAFEDGDAWFLVLE